MNHYMKQEINLGGPWGRRALEVSGLGGIRARRLQEWGHTAPEFAGVVGMGALTRPTPSPYDMRLFGTESPRKGAAGQQGCRRRRGGKPRDSEYGMG